ncbi:SusC/RagA family TonB-linked outer membrane protein [Sediminibacterium soli]|uniref:SusC/RagA family TonB-linked outer membrane protein n=1 Tax=Sediminibacterium soli TaxID=2698829 RepID=UPI00137A71E4|nr:SusC/RagA family TonB-linked outer membrane protein [Sediminibacterium soli]NCI47270.1 SusC/RagA family TonB-linked outer membrane protein [Sediminibacterium soli]
MKKIVSTLLVAMLCFVVGATAQLKTVTGKVTDEKGEPVPFASVVIKGKGKGTSADAAGSFSIKAQNGDVIEVSAVGFQSTSTPYTGQASLGFSLKAGDNTLLKEVVITSAFETKRSSRSSSNSAQTISGDQLATTRQLNVNNALAGKIAGIQVQSQASGKLGVENAIRIRGENGITGPSTALYVVNGTQMPSANDINPDDIESISVLQGPAAAALLGPAGANGAVVITTKKARRGEKGIGVTVNSNVTFDKVYKLPKYQNVYAGGGNPDLTKFTWVTGMPDAWKSLDGKMYPDYTDDASWGPAMQGQEYIPWYAWYPGTQYTGKTASLVAQPNNIKQFYNTGVNLNNNVSFSKATDNTSVRISYGNINQTGIIPTSKLIKHTLTTSTSIDLNPQLTLAANINYVTQTVYGEFSDGYSNNSTGNFNSWFHRDLDYQLMRDLSDLRSPQGYLASWNHSNPSSYSLTNPVSQANWYKGNYWYNTNSYFNNINNVNRKDRLYGDVSLTYKINSDFKLKGTYRKNQNTTWTENKTYSILEYSGVQTGLKAGYGTQNSYSNRENFEGLLSYAKKFNDFDVNANVGFDIFQSYSNQVAANTVNGLNVDNLYALNNSKNAIAYSNFREASKYRAGFVTGNVGWKNMVFADFTLRNDYYSQLPATANSVFIKSFGASFVFSDLINKTSNSIFSYGKLRASWGEVPATIGAYAYPGFSYSVAANQWGTNFLMSTPNTVVDPGIHGSVNTAKEAGIDLRFLRNRLGLSFTYWDQTSTDFPITTSLTPTTGFSGLLTNVGKVSKKGFDITLNAKPIWGKDFQWDVNVNFSRIIDNKVVSLGDSSVKQIAYANGSFGGRYVPTLVQAVGQQWGQLYGYRKQTINGVPILSSAGLWLREATPTYLGSVLPDFTGGVQNTFTYKNFVLNVNVDFQKGGKFASLSDFWGSFSGLTARTAAINDKGKNVRDDVAAGGGVHVFGVDNTGKPVDYYVGAMDYYQQTYSSRITDNNIYDLTFIKMRELSLGYNFDVKKLKVDKIFQSLRFSVVANNLWLIYSQSKDYDPAEISNSYGENGQYPGTRSLGVNLRIGF